MKKTILINILFSLLYQVIYSISGIIVPKLLLNTFGSEVNGLVSSLSSFLHVFVIIEGGLKAVIAAKLYKPLVDKDNDSFNKIVATGRTFYRKLAVYYALFSICLGLAYPLIKQTSFSFYYIFFLVIIIGTSSFVSYYSYVILSTIIYADNKEYITYIAYSIAAILNIIFVIVGVNVFPNIHFIKTLTFLSYLANPIILGIYVNKHYQINKKTKPDSSLLDQRWSGFSHNLCSFITSNVDIYVLTFFSDLIYVSIYSVYSLVISSIKQIISAISKVLVPFLGKAKASNNNVKETFNIQLLITSFFTIVIFACTYVLIIPFIKIYTLNITDANYINEEFAFIFVTSEFIECLTFPYNSVIYASGDFRSTKYLAYIETAINTILSIALVTKFKLIGVILATTVSRIVRYILQLFYLKNSEKEIEVNKSIIRTAKNILILVIIVFILNNIFNYSSINSYLSWTLYGIGSFAIALILCFLMLFIFEHNMLILLFINLVHRK